MRFSRFFAAALLGVLTAPAALAQQNSQTSVLTTGTSTGTIGDTAFTARTGLLDKAVTDFGPFTAKGGKITAGRSYEFSGIRGQMTFGGGAGEGGCEVDSRLGVFDAGATINLKVPGAKKSGEFGPNAQPKDTSPAAPKTGRQRAAKAAKMFGSCNVSAEASLAQVSAKCGTAVGEFGVTANGPSANVSCGCDGCEVGAALWWVEGEWTSPEIGACGISGKIKASLEGGEGVKLGIKKLGTAGAKIKAGPIGGGLGVDLTSFDPNGLKECFDRAVTAVTDYVSGVRDAFARLGSIFRNAPSAGMTLGERGGGFIKR